MTPTWTLGPGGYPMNSETFELMEWQEAVDYINELEARIERLDEMAKPILRPYTKALFMGDEGDQK